MPRRNPIVFVFVAVAVVLAGLLVLASTRRATTDGPVAAGSTTTITVTTTSRAPTVTATVTAPRGMGSVRVSALPSEARATLALIAAGGPYPYTQDGVVFQNREGHLPKKASGYYHEYTVETPGSSDRGARRIIVGNGGERYYTDDHYDSFRLIVA